MWWVVRRCSSDDVDEWKRGDVDEWKWQRAKIAEIKITGRNSGLLQGSTADFVMCGKPEFWFSKRNYGVRNYGFYGQNYVVWIPLLFMAHSETFMTDFEAAE